jgi:hypothetical protein
LVQFDVRRDSPQAIGFSPKSIAESALVFCGQNHIAKLMRTDLEAANARQSR